MGARAVEVRPFDQVRAGELRFEGDPNDPTRAVFHVTTTEPMICAIVWGEDASYGRFKYETSASGHPLESKVCAHRPLPRCDHE